MKKDLTGGEFKILKRPTHSHKLMLLEWNVSSQISKRRRAEINTRTHRPLGKKRYSQLTQHVTGYTAVLWSPKPLLISYN